MEWILRLTLFVVAFLGLHLGLGLDVLVAGLIAIVLAVLGVFLLVLVFDGDGSPW